MHRFFACALLLACFACASKADEPSCTPLGTMPGPEDFDLLGPAEHPTLIVSAAARREGQDPRDDGIWLLDYPQGSARRLAPIDRDQCSLRPHGIATAEVEPGRWDLWVINHHDLERDADNPQCSLPGKHSIEHFHVDPSALELRFVERLSSPLLTNPNDLDATADGRLWISNNPAWEKGGQLIGDMLFGRKRGVVLHYDPRSPEPERWRVALDKVLYANGVLIEEGDEAHLWVASARGKLERHPLGEQGTATVPERARYLRTDEKLQGTLDNLMWSEGALWLVAHPKSLAFLKHRKDPAKHAPTRVYRIDAPPAASEDPHAQRIVEVTRGQVDAGSTALPLEPGTVVVGQVFDEGLRVCPRP